MEQGRRRYVDYMSRKRASCVQRNECFIQRTTERKGGSTSKHCNAEPTPAELQLRIIVSVNQRGVYGAMADSCQDLAQQIAAHSPPSTGTPVANVDDDPASQVPYQMTNVVVWSPRNFGAATRREIQKSSRRPAMNESL